MNHVVTATEDLRREQVELTRRRIARAVVEVLVADGAAKLSFPAVAERSGVSLRTVYRHFPNKDALLAAAVDAGSEATVTAVPPGERTLAGMATFVPMLWREIHEGRDLMRVQHTTPGGIALRARRLRGRHAEITAAVEREVPELDDEAAGDLAALVSVLMSSPVLVDLVDHLGFTVDHAAALATFAIRAVTETARREGGVR